MFKFNENEDIQNLKNHIQYKNKIAEEFANNDVLDDLKFIEDKLENDNYKGIIIYSEAVMWEPIQRPHHFLYQLSKMGYICFFCESNQNENYNIKKKNENFYLINGQEKLLPLLKNRNVIFYISYFLQYTFAKNFINTTIWLDVLDRLDFFSNYNSYSKKIWKELIEKSDLVTYSATNLKPYIKNRKDAVLLKNAANPEDFHCDKIIVPDDMNKILKTNKIIIGYYGAIEKWFDMSIINILSETNKYAIVLIGNNGLGEKILNKENVYYLGPKKYEDLKYYASHFDVAIIPFIVNKITNNVSPVKFFEYLALGLPVISTNIYEMRFYSSNILKVIKKNKDIIPSIEKLIKINKLKLKEEATKLLSENTWNERAIIIDKLIR